MQNKHKTQKLTFGSSDNDKELYGRIVYGLYLSMLILLFSSSNAYAELFNLSDIKTKIVDTTFDFVNQSIAVIAFAVGGACTFLARGGDLLQKGFAFGGGSLVTAASIKIAKISMDIPDAAVATT